MKDLTINPIFIKFLALFIVSCFGLSQIAICQELQRIAIKKETGNASFYNKITKEKFTPYGFNYIRLNKLNENDSYHSTFDENLYNSKEANFILEKLANSGFNTVRVFINPGAAFYSTTSNPKDQNLGIAGAKNSRTLYQPYVSNLIDFLKLAKKNKIYTIITLCYVPQNKYFIQLAEAINLSQKLENIEDINAYYLSPGYIVAKSAYAKEIVQTIANIDNGQLLSTVFAWDIENEACFLANKKPFSLTAGSIKTADGLTYDMSKKEDRQQLADANIVNWANQISKAIKEIDPNALISASVFTYHAIGLQEPNAFLKDSRIDQRIPARPFALHTYSQLDYTDIHVYILGKNHQIKNDLKSSELEKLDLNKKPLVMGEFGAFKSQFANTKLAADAVNQQYQTMLQLGFSGALYWTINTHEQKELWNAFDDNETIFKSLIPKTNQ